jgi:hypothetical protein
MLSWSRLLSSAQAGASERDFSPEPGFRPTSFVRCEMLRDLLRSANVMVAVPPPTKRSSASAVPDNSPEPNAAVTESAEEAEMPLSSDPQTFVLGGLFALSGLAALYVASSIILPVVLAFVFDLLLQPAVRLLERLRLRSGKTGRVARKSFQGQVSAACAALLGGPGSAAPSARRRTSDRRCFLGKKDEVDKYLEIVRITDLTWWI